MTVISTTKDVNTLTLIVVAEFEAEPADVWQVWEDPRQLELWWGPPGCPATFTRHDFVVGGQSRYGMNVPDGTIARGWWRIDGLDKPHRIDFVNGLAGEDGEPMAGVEPMTGYVAFDAIASGTRMTAFTQFFDVEQMEQMLGLGMVEGMTAAISQIDGLLAPANV